MVVYFYLPAFQSSFGNFFDDGSEKIRLFYDLRLSSSFLISMKHLIKQLHSTYSTFMCQQNSLNQYIFHISGLPFSSLHVYPSTTVVKPTWLGVATSETEPGHLNQQQQLHSVQKQNLVLGSSSSNYRVGKQFAFLQGDNNTLHSQTPPEASVCQPLLRAAPFSEGSGGSHSMFCDRLTTPVQDSDCALSLLSSPRTQTSGISLSTMVQPHSFPLVQPLGPSVQNHIIEPMDSVVVANGRDTAVHCPGMFHMGSGGSSGSEAPQTLPFHWQ